MICVSEIPPTGMSGYMNDSISNKKNPKNPLDTKPSYESIVSVIRAAKMRPLWCFATPVEHCFNYWNYFLE